MAQSQIPDPACCYELQHYTDSIDNTLLLNVTAYSSLFGSYGPGSIQNQQIRISNVRLAFPTQYDMPSTQPWRAPLGTVLCQIGARVNVFDCSMRDSDVFSAVFKIKTSPTFEYDLNTVSLQHVDENGIEWMSCPRLSGASESCATRFSSPSLPGQRRTQIRSNGTGTSTTTNLTLGSIPTEAPHVSILVFTLVGVLIIVILILATWLLYRYRQFLFFPKDASDSGPTYMNEDEEDNERIVVLGLNKAKVDSKLRGDHHGHQPDTTASRSRSRPPSLSINPRSLDSPTGQEQSPHGSSHQPVVIPVTLVNSPQNRRTRIAAGPKKALINQVLERNLARENGLPGKPISEGIPKPKRRATRRMDEDDEQGLKSASSSQDNTAEITSEATMTGALDLATSSPSPARALSPKRKRAPSSSKRYSTGTILDPSVTLLSHSTPGTETTSNSRRRSSTRTKPAKPNLQIQTKRKDESDDEDNTPLGVLKQERFSATVPYRRSPRRVTATNT